MQELIIKDYNGFGIEFELIDGQLMANATSMCAAFGKKPNDWLKTGGAKRFIEAKAKKIVLAENKMVYTQAGGNAPGTWIHESLVLKVAAWLDVDFEVQCDEWLTELSRTGTVALKPKSSLEVLSEVVQNLIAQDNRISAVEQHHATLQQAVDEVRAQVTNVPTDFFTVAGWASLQKKPVPISAANALGRQAAKLSKAQGFEIGKVSDQRYGAVNSYHREVLRQILP